MKKIIEFVVRYINKYKRWKRERAIIEKCGCICFCPNCYEPLNDTSEWVSSGEGRGCFQCANCKNISEWHFGISPVPLLLNCGHDHRSLCNKMTEKERVDCFNFAMKIINGEAK